MMQDVGLYLTNYMLAVFTIAQLCDARRPIITTAVRDRQCFRYDVSH